MSDDDIERTDDESKPGVRERLRDAVGTGSLTGGSVTGGSGGTGGLGTGAGDVSGGPQDTGDATSSHTADADPTESDEPGGAGR